MSLTRDLALIVLIAPAAWFGLLALLLVVREVDECRAAARPQDHEHVEGDYR